MSGSVDNKKATRSIWTPSCALPPTERPGRIAAAHGLDKDLRVGARDLACLLLADLSLSTDTWIDNYARMGAAIRQAAGLLQRQPAGCHLLLILSDGKPNDLDKYEGRYGIEDTRKAIYEAKQIGVQPFCVTVDTKASEYLPHLFGNAGYVVIHKPSQLPKELPLLYARLTSNRSPV